MPRVLVIGAGAAGTMAAIFAATAGADTTLVERTRDGGRKILISGGGRCNILPAAVDESRFVTDSSPHTLRNIVRSWPLREQVAFFENEAGIPLVEEPASAKLFPRSNSARDVRDRLYDLARRRGVVFMMSAVVQGFEPLSSGWRVAIAGAGSINADAVIVATGGLSVPATGSDGLGLHVARDLGHTVHATYPALTPLTAVPAPFAELSGVSLPVSVMARSATRSAYSRGGFLFTHVGYSGPAILDVSHVAVRARMDDDPTAVVKVQWSEYADEQWTAALRPAGTRTVAAAVSAKLPTRLAEALIAHEGVAPRQTLAHLTRGDRIRLIDALVRFPLPCTGDEGYKKAEVTGGGVNLGEIDPRTMESRRHPRLFLCGEMLDAFGPIGGYNFLWAWATGRAAGLGAARSVLL
ncbi:MAG TPA: aminoacetone oxidase family FAD-binding enzyme [Vicinamibacterales bacterium]|nr:aminoacetone oxidase family FAD-binding enzyme [Vicinamibacterales bacterium]